jgi:hypothetical protein
LALLLLSERRRGIEDIHGKAAIDGAEADPSDGLGDASGSLKWVVVSVG